MSTAPRIDPVDPWPIVRDQHPGVMLVRVIYHEVNVQLFLEIPRNKATLDAGMDLWDGATIFNPATPFTSSMREQLIAAADRAWNPAHHASPAA